MFVQSGVIPINKKWRSVNNLYDKDKRKILVERCQHCSHTGWVVVGIAANGMGALFEPCNFINFLKIFINGGALFQLRFYQ